MPWTQATDPVNTDTWLGRCSQGDIDLDALVPTSTPTTGVYLLDGFEDDSNLEMWSVSGGLGVTVDYSTTVRSGGVTGGKSLKITNNGTPRSVSRTPITWPDTLHGRVYFMINNVSSTGNPDEEHSIVMMRDGGQGHFIVVAQINTSSFKIGAQVGSSTIDYVTAAMSYGTWYRIEFTASALAAGGNETFDVTVYSGDSTTAIEALSGVPTTLSGQPLAFYLGDSVSASRTFDVYYDDICLRQNSRPGPGGIWLGTPDADSSNGWTPLTGTSNYAMVDDFPGNTDDATTYNSSSVDAATDLFHWSWANSTPGTDLRAYQTEVCARAAIPTSSAIVKMALRTGMDTYLGQDVTIGSPTYTMLSGEAARSLYQIWGGVIKSELQQAYRFGYKRISGAGTPRITTSWINVDMR